MKYTKYSIVALLWCSMLFPFSGRSFMTYRSQGINLARDNSGWRKQCTENNFSFSFEYTSSTNPAALNNYFFGTNQLYFSGSRVPNRGGCDILADYFGLPTDFQSTLSFCPRIQNFISDFDAYWLLGCDQDSRWNLRVNVPIVRTKWALNPCEKIIASGTADYPAGYMSNALMLRSTLPQGALGVLADQEIFGDVMSPLQYGRISRCPQVLTKFSDIYVALGYNILCQEDGFLAVDLNVTIPTGTRSCAVPLFEPQIGNGRHWGLGAGASGEWLMDERGDMRSFFCVDARVQHLFGSAQARTYDLIKNGPGSRYTLLMDMIRMISVTQGFSPNVGEGLVQNQYITRLLYASDATTLNSNIKINAQGELNVKLLTEYQRWNFEVGYNLWARSAEKLTCRQKLDHEFYGIKGDAQVYGFLDIGVINIPLPLNATQSESTLRKAQGVGNTVNNFVNINADNAALMYNVGAPLAQTTPGSLTNTGATILEQVNGSDQAIVLSDADINECSGLSPRAISNKIFGTIRYDWDGEEAIPYVLVGVEGEFAATVNGLKTSVSQWGIWLKLGVNY